MEIGFFSATIVQVAISIVISWALFALLCSMVHEVFVQLKSERGRFFRSKIVEKLYDPSNQINWGLLIYNHSSVKLLTKSSAAPPSEINCKTSAEALIDAVANSHAAQSLKFNTTAAAQSEYKNELLNNLEFAVTNLGQSDVIMMLRNAMVKAKIKATTTGDINEDTLYTEIVDDIRQWFEQFGERTTSWYKKASQKRLFLLGLIIATATNIDSIALFVYFKENPTARTGMIDYYTKHQAQLESLSERYNAASPKDSAVIAVDARAKKEMDTAVVKETELFATQMDSLSKSLELPVGWEKANCGPVTVNSKNTTCKQCSTAEITFVCVLCKVFGIIISAFAASLGAPFWFDLLKRATTASETIIKKDKS